MKKVIFALVILFLFSCNNDSEIEKNDSILGKWKWIESSGGISGRTDSPSNTGKNILLEISESTIKTYENGLLKTENSYQIQWQNSILGGKREMIIIGTGSNEFKQSFEVKSNVLYLSDECFDCFQSKYAKE